MQKINLFDAIKLKKAIKSQFDIDLHFHDSCAGQYFELEATNDLITEFLSNYFLEKNLAVIFNNDKNMFILEDIRQC